MPWRTCVSEPSTSNDKKSTTGGTLCSSKIWLAVFDIIVILRKFWLLFAMAPSRLLETSSTFEKTSSPPSAWSKVIGLPASDQTTPCATAHVRFAILCGKGSEHTPCHPNFVSSMKVFERTLPSFEPMSM